MGNDSSLSPQLKDFLDQNGTRGQDHAASGFAENPENL